MRLTRLTYLLFFLIPAACDAQATPDYQGDPLATITGTLTSQRQGALPESDLVLAWPDWSKGDADSTAVSTFVRVQVSAQLPAHFSAQIFQPPPASAYVSGTSASGFTATGPRYASARILLAKRGVTVTDSSINLVNPEDGQVLAAFDDYVLTYFESDGTPGVRGPDGRVATGPHVTKGFHLVQQHWTECSNGIDQACLDQAMQTTGTITDFDRYFCSKRMGSGTATELPLDTPMELVVTAPDAPLVVPPPCPAP